jgi:ribosomal protein S18 acetylase RimI-like enzyme
MTWLVPMIAAEFEAFIAEATSGYAADQVRAAQWTADEALALSRQSFDALLPQGLATPGNWLYSLVDDDQSVVGVLWVAEQLRAGRPIAYVYNLRISPAHQRHGHASRALLALEAQLPAMGLSGIALHVFGHNAPATALYAKLGFEPTSIHLFKSTARAGD